MIQIVPAILALTEEQYKENVEKISSSNELSDGWVQIDFTDNKFVQSQTVDLEIVQKYPLHINKEAHLMVEDPLNWLDNLKKAGFSRVLFHLEVEKTEAIIKKINQLGMEAGIVLNHETQLGKLALFLDHISVVQLMSVKPGSQGQPFIPEVVEKIKSLARLRTENEVNFVIGVDGGLNAETMPQVVKAGAQRLVVGSALLQGDINENLETFWEILHY